MAEQAIDLPALHRLRELPPLSPRIVEALEALTGPEVDYAAVERTLAYEPTVAARVLRLANSPFFGFPSRIGSLREACLVLGSHSLRHVVLASAALAVFPAADEAMRRLLWGHSVAVATAARHIADRVGLDPDLTASGALLHDLGLLALHALYPAACAAVVRLQRERGCLLIEAERALLGFDHAAVGAGIAARWQLPAELQAMIGGHHQPGQHHDPLVDAVHVADVATVALQAAQGAEVAIPCVDPGSLERLGVRWEWLDAALPKMAEALAAEEAGGD